VPEAPNDRRVQVVGLGLAALDILVRTDELPTWDCGVRLQALGIDGGGPVATALVAAQRLGVQTGFIGTFGDDRMGRIKLQTLVEEGVDTSRSLIRHAPEDQAVLVCVHSLTGERMFSGISHAQPLRVDELDRAYITSADILHLDGYHPEAALQAARWMHDAGKKIMVDGSSTHGPVSEPMKKLVGLADVLICGTGFGPALTGLQDLWQAGEAMLRMGPQVVVQTEGKSGSYATTQSERIHVLAYEVDVVDTTGAGDVFHGAYLAGMLQNWEIRTILQFSTAVAAIKCKQLGGRQGIPTFEQVSKFLETRGIYLP
jgi:sulfofructose kinase